MQSKWDGVRKVPLFRAPDVFASCRKVELEQDLRHALDRREFEIHNQPIIDLKSEVPVSYEALLRWNHPRRGGVSPTEFIPVAEEAGLIEPKSDWVMHQACMEAAQWTRPCRVAVNVSAVQFKAGSGQRNTGCQAFTGQAGCIWYSCCGIPTKC